MLTNLAIAFLFSYGIFVLITGNHLNRWKFSYLVSFLFVLWFAVLGISIWRFPLGPESATLF